MFYVFEMFKKFIILDNCVNRCFSVQTKWKGTLYHGANPWPKNDVCHTYCFFFCYVLSAIFVIFCIACPGTCWFDHLFLWTGEQFKMHSQAFLPTVKSPDPHPAPREEFLRSRDFVLKWIHIYFCWKIICCSSVPESVVRKIHYELLCCVSFENLFPCPKGCLFEAP